MNENNNNAESNKSPLGDLGVYALGGWRGIRFLFLFFLLLNTSLAWGKVFYVAPDGTDSNLQGTIENPFESIKKAQIYANAGDTVYIRGGNYQMRMDQIAQYNDIWAYVTVLDKSGSEGKMINYWAYPEETPVFDYSAIKPAEKRIFAFYLTGSYIHIKGIEVVGVQVTITGHTQSECFEIKGSNNILEQISMHDGMAIGVYILRGSNNLILNCDAYRNYDSVSENGVGGNTDGFGCHAPTGHKNNIFRGCRAWLNSDDGYDCISSGEPVLFDHCWAFYNGYSGNFISRGDGNGFKAGGYGSTALDRLPNPIPSNTVQFCLSVRNKQSGFYSNHHLTGSKWYNNTAYLNKRNFNMLNREGPTANGYLKDVPGWGHTLKNNLGLGATYQELTDIDTAACDLTANYFDLDVVVTKDDFLSLDQSLLTAPREADGSLPVNDFMRLAPNSDLINRGINIGFQFKGLFPDLGCFESDDNTAVDEPRNRYISLNVFPNPFNAKTEIVFNMSQQGHGNLSLYNLSGKQVKMIVDQDFESGTHTFSLNRTGLNTGMYFLVARLGNTLQTQKLVVN
ncbi:MAG: T9SS type A sorting domain-containing protein [Prolixibacteraceae bacterium]